VYVVRVWLFADQGANPGNTYSLSATVVSTSPAGCVDDAFEQNDSSSTAYSLGTGAFNASSLSACPGDDDWYSYYLAYGEVLNLTLTFSDAMGNIDVQVFDSSGSLYSGSYSNNDNEVLNLAIPSTGSWSIRVFLNGGDDSVPGNSYNMSVSFTPVPSCADDGFEHNDTSAAAYLLPTSNFNAAGLTACPGDDDWYSYYAAAGEELSIQVVFPNAAGDINVELYNPSGTWQSGSYSTTDNEYLTLNVPSTGFWKLRIYLANDDSNPGNNYNLGVSYIPAANCVEDSYENNDSTSTATMVGGGPYPGTQLTNLRSCSGDDDWFRVWAYAGDNLVVNLWFIHAFGDIDAEIYAPGSSSPAAVGLTSSSNEGLATVATVSGHWQVRVFMAFFDDSVPGNSYDIDIWQY